MTLPTHLMAGLVIGKLTGNYVLSVMGALLVDVDHIFSYIKNGILFKPEKFWQTITARYDPYGDQRYYLHNVLVFVLLTGFTYFLANKNIGFVFGLAYLSHLVLDALDNADYFPFFPSKKINLRGPVGYFSKVELTLFFLLAVLFYLV